MTKRDESTRKLAAKREVWVKRTAEALQLPPDQVLALLQQERRQSLRLNPLRADSAKLAKQLTALGWLGAPYAWALNGYTAAAPLETLRDSEQVTSGQVFIQNAASWLPVIALDPRANETILDVCAAPGGKTSHIAALTNNQAVITANDNSRPRLAKMRANLTRLGAQDVQFTLFDAGLLARKLEGQQFDKILLDAPCSGEGLMRYSRDKDFDSWSVAHIKRLSKLQKRILSQSWQLLKPGGTLVYSTCTMAPEENEAVIDYLLRTHPEAQIIPLDIKLPNTVPTVKTWNNKAYRPEVGKGLRLSPSPEIEAFFVCVLRKSDEPVTTKLAISRHMRYDAD